MRSDPTIDRISAGPWPASVAAQPGAFLHGAAAHGHVQFHMMVGIAAQSAWQDQVEVGVGDFGGAGCGGSEDGGEPAIVWGHDGSKGGIRGL